MNFLFLGAGMLAVPSAVPVFHSNLLSTLSTREPWRGQLTLLYSVSAEHKGPVASSNAGDPFHAIDGTLFLPVGFYLAVTMLLTILPVRLYQSGGSCVRRDDGQHRTGCIRQRTGRASPDAVRQ